MILVGSDGERIELGAESTPSGGVLVPLEGPPGKDSTVPGPPGRNVEGITLSGENLVFDMSHGADITVAVPAITEANEAAGRAEDAAEVAVQTAAGIQDVASDAAQVAEDRLAVESAASAVATDRQTVTDARGVVVTAKGDVEQIQTDVHQTKTNIENTANLVDQTLEQYGAQFVVERELSQQAVTDATLQAQRAEDAAEDIIAGAVLDDSITTVKLVDGAVTKAKASLGVQASLDRADGAVQEGDSRLTDDRPPTAHSHQIADVTGLADTYARLDEQRFAGMATFFHDFEGMTPGSTAPVVTDSGHEVYWDSQPPFFTGNDFTSLSPGGATYACTEDLGATVTHVGARFKYAPNGGGDGGLCCVAITDRRWSLANIAETNMGVHFWCTPTTWALTVWEAGTGQVPIVYGYFDTRLTADGATEYMMQCWISGNKATIILPDGERKVALDDRFTTLSGNFAFFESMPNAATDDLACISAVRAGTGKTRPPWSV